MNNQGNVILRGRVGSDLKSMTTQSGTKGVRFRLAASQWRITDSGQYQEREPRWYTVCVWDRLAKNLMSSVEKGTPIIVSGRPSARAWIGPDAEARAELVINASFCGLDLVFGPAVVLKPKVPTRNVQESSTLPAGEYATSADSHSEKSVGKHDCDERGSSSCLTDGHADCDRPQLSSCTESDEVAARHDEDVHEAWDAEVEEEGADAA